MSRFLFATLLVVVPSSLGLVRCVIFYFFKPFIMEKILSSELSFFILLISRLFVTIPSSFYKIQVVVFLVGNPSLLHGWWVLFIAIWLLCRGAGWISLKSTRWTIPLCGFVSSVILAVSVNGPLRPQAMLKRAWWAVFYCCKIYLKAFHLFFFTALLLPWNPSL